jgi:hypothetical protein
MGMEHDRRVGTRVVWGLDLSRDTPAPRRILWGLFLMGLGGVLLLAQLDIVKTPSLWQLWPAVFWVIGLSSLLNRKPGGAATMALIGFAFFAAQFGWLGLSYRTFWPLLVVAFGAGTVVAALSGEDDRCAKPEVDRGDR